MPVVESEKYEILYNHKWRHTADLNAKSEGIYWGKSLSWWAPGMGKLSLQVSMDVRWKLCFNLEIIFPPSFSGIITWTWTRHVIELWTHRLGFTGGRSSWKVCEVVVRSYLSTLMLQCSLSHSGYLKGTASSSFSFLTCFFLAKCTRMSCLRIVQEPCDLWFCELCGSSFNV